MRILLLSMPDAFEHTPTLAADAQRRPRVTGGTSIRIMTSIADPSRVSWSADDRRPSSRRSPTRRPL